MPVKPEPGVPVVPIAQEVKIVAGEVEGQAIAMQLVGSSMYYLIVDYNTEAAPVWVGEAEVRRTF